MKPSFPAPEAEHASPPHALSRAVYALESTAAHSLSQTNALKAQNALLEKSTARARAALRTAARALADLQRTHALALGDLARARAAQAAQAADKAELKALLGEERLGRARAEGVLGERAREAYVYRCAMAAVFKLPGTSWTIQ
ncbi:hypothetical protein ESCO_005560 [Escovopsis weberi]|uniref:Uncharacterized protein n=1 Tax=Escovopsis weberi TaxID=150374 RepID=A0A0N0RTJ7_ESCWE|nr:hypothetical protein ESCO_005560 [Escovopsis weberi]